VNQHDMTGLNVPPRDEHSLAAAISRILEDEPLRRKFGDAGRRRFLDNFTLPRMIDQTLSTYDTASQAC
jgi:rhamnosyl/mannosyltransferase